jgi:hypothetical protein
MKSRPFNRGHVRHDMSFPAFELLICKAENGSSAPPSMQPQI